MAFNIRRRNLTRVVLALGFALVVRFFVVSSTPSYSPNDHEIQGSNMLDLVSRPDNVLDVRRYKFLQSRVGRDEKPDLLGDIVTNGVKDFWERLQKP